MCISSGVISDHLKQDMAGVHAYMNAILWSLKENYVHIQNIPYFSDGAASQHKKFKNLVNLCHHKQDFIICLIRGIFCYKS